MSDTLGEIEARVKRLEADKRRLVDPTKPVSLDFDDDNSRMLVESNWVALAKLRRVNTTQGNVIPSLEQHASGLEDLPVDLEEMKQKEILAEVTLDNRFEKSLSAITRAKGSWNALARHAVAIVGLVVVGVLGSILVYNLSNPLALPLEEQAFASIDWPHAAIIAATVAAVVVVGFMGWRSHSKSQQQTLGGGRVQ